MVSSELTWRDSGRVSSVGVLRAIALAALCIVLAIAALNVAFWSCRGEVPGSSPPDLSGCTRIEIRYLPTIMGYPIWSNQAEKDLLTPEEIQYVEMLLQFVVDDPERISTFAQMIASGSYRGDQSGTVRTKTVAIVLCRFSDRSPIRLMVYGTSELVTEDKRIFSYRGRLGILARVSSQVRSSQLLQQIRLRIRCARNLHYLRAGLRGFEDEVAFPSASAWCDSVASRCLRGGDAEREVFGHFACPAVSGGNCHYAMNPDCRPDCPPETVLLFETRAGWNQHGGPELFTFDNHDPKGGCVLLNDLTVKFIRTKEELKQLRWK